MAKGKSFFESKGFKVVMSRIYGLGAAVVIVGALFKITHWKGADTMLTVGLLTEAGIFSISAFEPVKKEIDWTLVYPELAGLDPKKGGKEEKLSMTEKLDKMLQEAKIEQSMVNRLGEGLRNLGENVNKMATASDAALATSEYASKVKEASSSVNQLNGAYHKAIQAIDEMGKTGDISTEYNEKVQSVTQKLASLNSVYEMELQESNNHIRQLNTYYETLAKAVENLADSEAATSQVKTEFSKLGQNLSVLNTVYGNMLSAMTVSRG
jgi:gliding motility-associated protein GldL